MKTKPPHPLLRMIIPLLAAATGVWAADPGSLVFDKQSSKGHVNCGDVFAVKEGTVEFWFKPATNENNEWVVSIKKDRENSLYFGFGMEALQFTIQRSGEFEYTVCEKDRVPIGQWHHVACAFGNGKAVIFVDGVGRYRKNNPGKYTLEHLTGGELRIGVGNKDDERFNGMVAEVRLSKSVRYTEDFTPPAIPLSADQDTIALWHFAEEGDTLTDAGRQALKATVVGNVERSKEMPGTGK